MKTNTKIILGIFTLVFMASSNAVSAQNGRVTVKEDPRVTSLMSLKTYMQKENKLTDGYTIQLYYGELSKANSTLKEYKQKFTQWPASIEYETPNYKVWVGNFQDRLEADRALMNVQEYFPSAFILQPGKNKKEE